jgi:hypothetical protein
LAGQALSRISVVFYSIKSIIGMKTIILSIAVLLFISHSHAQQRIRPVHDKDYYLQKSQKLNTGAWILVTTGAIATTAGILVINNNHSGNDFYEDFGGTIGGIVLTAVGIVAVTGSIPLFVVGGHLKKKAARVSFNNQKILLPSLNSFVARIQPGISLRISL